MSQNAKKRTFSPFANVEETYNHATSNLAKCSQEKYQDKLSEAYNSLFLSSRCMTNYISTCSFLWKAYGDKLIYWKDICCRYTLELPQWGNSNVYLQHMLLKIREKNIWKFTFSNYNVHIVSTFVKHSKLPISIKIPVTLLQIIYNCMTSKLEFMNYLFDSLLVAWLL